MRANVHVNKHNIDELLFTKSNNDVTLIDNVKGNVGYCCNYVSKPDSPDANRYVKILMRTLATLPQTAPLRDQFRRALQASQRAVITSSQQAVWFLHGRKIVSAPRDVVKLNPLSAAELYTYVPVRGQMVATSPEVMPTL